MARTMADLQEILFAEIDSLASITEGRPTDAHVRQILARADAVNQTAQTIISAGDLILRSMTQASRANKLGMPLNSAVIGKLTGVSNEDTNASLQISDTT